MVTKAASMQRVGMFKSDAAVDAGPTADTASAAKKKETALMRHISFFQDVAADGTGTGVVRAGGTRKGLGELGLGFVSRGFGGVALTAPFSIPQNKSLFANKVAMDRIHEGVRADGTDTGIYDKEGNVNPEAFTAFWKATAGEKGYINDADIAALVKGKAVNALEFHLLMTLAGQITDKGERVLTLPAVLAFYDGSMFPDLAKARAENKLYKPTGVMSHDGPKEIAKGLASQALQFGGAEAGDGARALAGINLTIDEGASLAYQQLTKSLGPTLAGAFKAMCPAGKA